MKYFFLLGILLSFNIQAFDKNHKSFNDLLGKVVSFKGAQTLVDYKNLKKDPAILDQYLKELSGVKKEDFYAWSKSDQLAFLINAYNAFTLKLIIDNYPVKSIKKIGGLFSNPWKIKFFELLGEKTYLDHIEHDLIRPIYKEPRIHFAVNCASISCPNIQPFAFTGVALEKQLEMSAKSFLEDKNKNYYADNTLHLSKIFKWYGGDFKDKFGNFKNFVAKYITKDQESIKVEFLSYDWDLNESK